MNSLNLIKETLNEFTIEKIKIEEQNKEYEGALLTINNSQYRSRLAKLTPKKKGYFVAFWEKDQHQKNQAYSYNESPDKLIIAIIDNQKKGLFIFPKQILLQKNILRTEDQKGKMAMRIYPSWETDLNPNATKTQAWQLPFFIDLTDTNDTKLLLEFLT